MFLPFFPSCDILAVQAIAVAEYIRKEFTSMQLTKDAQTILYVLYKEYADRRKHGFSKSKSKRFNSASFIQENFFPDLPLEDVEDSLRELGRNNFLDNFYADNTVYFCALSDYGISVMETQKQDALLNLASFLIKFVPRP